MVRAKPKAKGPSAPVLAVDADGRSLLQLSVLAPPAEGAANAALRTLVATLAEVSPSQVALEAGSQAKVKRFHIKGDAAAIMAALARTTEI